MTELDVVRGIADGSLSSPQQFGNSTYWSIRISGTGCAWRESMQEYCWRDASIWLSQEMCIRCACIPILMGHPEIGVLNSREFSERSVGTTVHAYVKGDELWGIARILDAGANEILASGGYNDTSPAVVFDPGSGARIEVDGKTCLVEGCPGQTLRNATAQIFADSIAASSSSESYGETLREVRRRDPDTGHLIKEYYGEPRAWMRQFAGGPPRLARFNFTKNNNA